LPGAGVCTTRVGAGGRARPRTVHGAVRHKVVPNLWSDNQAEEAAACCTSVFPHSRVVHVLHGVPAG